MKVRCICENLMNDETLENCTVYSTYANQEYYNLLESKPKTVEELVDNMPSSDPFWKCKRCGRLHFFCKGKILIYNIEKELEG